MSPVGLSKLLDGLPRTTDPNLLVGFETGDDAGVYRLDAGTALVHTADIITPPVDDPVVFGRIAAANALSDVYAMGGRPLTCLNLVGFPTSKLGGEVLAAIVAGALEKIHHGLVSIIDVRIFSALLLIQHDDCDEVARHRLLMPAGGETFVVASPLPGRVPRRQVVLRLAVCTCPGAPQAVRGRRVWEVYG